MHGWCPSFLPNVFYGVFPIESDNGLSDGSLGIGVGVVGHLPPLSKTQKEDKGGRETEMRRVLFLELPTWGTLLSIGPFRYKCPCLSPPFVHLATHLTFMIDPSITLSHIPCHASFT